jgi:hypothetical protein
MPAREFCSGEQAVERIVAITCGRIVTGDHSFVGPLAKLTVNAINWVDARVRVSADLSLSVD